MRKVRAVATFTLAACIHLPIVAWLQPPFFASWALGIAALCIARAGTAGVAVPE